MVTFQIANKTIDQALRTGQIGVPVAAHVTACLSSDHGSLEPNLVHILSAVVDWMESEPEWLAAFGSVPQHQLSSLLSFSGGQSAIVSVGCCGMGPPVLEILVWGNRGALSYSWHGQDGEARQHVEGSGLSQRAKGFLSAVRQSVQTGRAVPLSEEADVGDVVSQSGPPQILSGHIQLVAQRPPYGVLLVTGDHTHQPNYAQALAADPRCRIVAMTDQRDVPARRRELNQQMAARLAIPYVDDLQAALQRADVHAVSICAEPERRGPIIVAAAGAGKHLYLDKPLAGSLAEADAIVAAVRERPIVTHMWSFVRADVTQHMRRAVDAQTLGDIRAIHLDVSFAKGHAGTAQLGRARRESATPSRYERADSKRELTNVGVYPLVTLLWLLGKPVRRVVASTGNYFFREHQANDMEDFGQILLELEDQSIASISAGRTGWYSHPAAGLHRATIAGTQRVVTFDNYQPRAEVWGDVEPWRAPERNPEDPMSMWASPQPERYVARPKLSWITPASATDVVDARYFLDCIEAGRASDVSALLAACATRILLAAYQSAAMKQVVAL